MQKDLMKMVGCYTTEAGATNIHATLEIYMLRQNIAQPHRRKTSDRVNKKDFLANLVSFHTNNLILSLRRRRGRRMNYQIKIINNNPRQLIHKFENETPYIPKSGDTIWMPEGWKLGETFTVTSVHHYVIDKLIVINVNEDI
jgi:hypothetical protein